MSSHVYHESLPGYDPRQILHDGCEECEARGRDIESALAHLDHQRFQAAWRRAYDWNSSNGNFAAVQGNLSLSETSLLRVLWMIQVMLERQGVQLTGEIPR